MTAKEVVLNAFAAIFSTFDPATAERLLAPDYVQHSPAVPTGAAPILGSIPALKESGVGVTTHRVIAEDDLVVLHNTYRNADLLGAPTLVGFDVFRVENGRVAEHWDNLQPEAGPNPSGRSMVDGATEVTGRDRTAANKALVLGFVRDVLRGAAPEKITDYVSMVTYIQHNPKIADGLAGLSAALEAMAAAGVTMVYTETPITVAEGDFVLTASEGTFGGAPTAFFDLFRVEDGRIVEHWDTIAEIPAEMTHENGKF